jgi:hypothetical protein
MEPTVIESTPLDTTQSFQERIVDEQEQLAGPRVLVFVLVGNVVTIGLALWFLLSH